MERREIIKTEGIARSTLQELLKGPDNPAYQNVFPEGTRLLHKSETGWDLHIGF